MAAPDAPRILTRNRRSACRSSCETATAPRQLPGMDIVAGGRFSRMVFAATEPRSREQSGEDYYGACSRIGMCVATEQALVVRMNAVLLINHSGPTGMRRCILFHRSRTFARSARATYVVSISRETPNRTPAVSADARRGPPAPASGVGTHCLDHERPTIYQYDRSQ